MLGNPHAVRGLRWEKIDAVGSLSMTNVFRTPKVPSSFLVGLGECSALSWMVNMSTASKNASALVKFNVHVQRRKR